MQAGFYHEPVEVTIMTRSRETGGGCNDDFRDRSSTVSIANFRDYNDD